MSDPRAAQLKEAISQRRDAEALALIDGGLSVNVQVSKNETPLSLALQYSQWALAEALLDRGADADGKLYDYHSYLAWAGYFMQRQLAARIISKMARPHALDREGKTALAWAVKLSLKPEIERLIGAGADLDTRDQSGYSLLHHAALQSDVTLVTVLVGARPQLVEALTYEQKQNALHLAASMPLYGTPAMVATLLAAGVSPTQPDSQGQTPLVLAAAYNSQAVLDVLLDTGITLTQSDRALALKLAVPRSQDEQVARLMAGFDLSLPLNDSHPLRVAASLKHWKIVKTVLSAGVDPDSRLPESGQPLLEWSVSEFQPELARALLEAGATAGSESALRWLENLMLLRKVSKVKLEAGTGVLEPKLLVALQENIGSLGFVLSAELAERVLTLSLEELRAFYALLIPCLRTMVGADKHYKPMYPNFPDQVKEASSLELYLNAALHYWGDAIGRRILPNYYKAARQALEEKTPLRVLGLAAADEATRVFQNVLAARGSLSAEDKELLSLRVLSQRDSLAGELPKDLPFRENAALLAAALLRYTSLHEQAAGYMKNGVDVLRTMAAYSGGDVSLADNTRFARLPKAVRRWCLAALEADPNRAESLWRHPEKFKRLGERIHPGEFRKRFPQTAEAFQQLRAGVKPATYASQIEQSLFLADLEACLPLLKTRPGDFARRLDHLLRVDPAQVEQVVEAFAQIAPRLPSPLLLQLRKHFQARHRDIALRTVFPKGDMGKLKAVDTPLPALDEALCAQIGDLCRAALLAQFGNRPNLGACWLDPRLQNYTVPFAMRSASKALRTVARGSRIAFSPEPGDTVRFFIWWRDGKGRTDLDLSALVLDENFSYQTELAYYNLKELGGYHSGDITSAPEGASEFIDIDVPTFLGRGSRYVMMVVNSFTVQPYCDLPECFAGFMRRAQPQSGEIYEPRTLINKFDLTANTTIAIPLILDLQRREVIWTDLSLKRNPSKSNNVHGNRSSLSLLCQSMLNLNKPNLYDLFELHIEARGQRVDQPEQAQTVFCAEPVEGAISPYDTTKILAEYL